MIISDVGSVFLPSSFGRFFGDWLSSVFFLPLSLEPSPFFLLLSRLVFFLPSSFYFLSLFFRFGVFVFEFFYSSLIFTPFASSLPF